MPGLATAAADVALDAIAGAFTWMQQHVGDPGSAGTANVATASTRFQITWDTASANLLDNTAPVEYDNVPADEEWTFFTVWSANVAGNFGFSGTVTNGEVLTGADVVYDTGQITVQFTLTS